MARFAFYAGFAAVIVWYFVYLIMDNPARVLPGMIAGIALMLYGMGYAKDRSR